MALQRAGGWLGQERVGIPPEQVWGEGQREGQSVHAVGELDGRDLHVLLSTLRSPQGETEAGSPEAGQTGRTLKWRE